MLRLHMRAHREGTELCQLRQELVGEAESVHVVPRAISCRCIPNPTSVHAIFFNWKMNCLDTHPFLYGTRYCCDKDTQCDVLGSVGFSDGLCNLVERQTVRNRSTFSRASNAGGFVIMRFLLTRIVSL